MFAYYTIPIYDLRLTYTISRIEIVKPKIVRLQFKWAGALREPNKEKTSKDLKMEILREWLETD